MKRNGMKQKFYCVGILLCGGFLALAEHGEKTGCPANTARKEIISVMNAINQRARDEDWPAARAGAARREFARRQDTNLVSIAELKSWVEKADALPVVPAVAE